MRHLFATALALSMPALTCAESIDYQVYALESCGRALITKGTRAYSVREIDSKCNKDREGELQCQKSLPLEGGFRIGVSVAPRSKLSGLGLRVRQDQNDGGFSWDWFEQE